MRWLGQSYDELMALPEYHYRTAIEMLDEEVEALERAKND